MATELKTVTWHDDGNCDIGRIVENIETVRDVADETERLRLSNHEDLMSTYPASVGYVIEARGDHTALPKAVRAEMKLSQCFIAAGTDGSNGIDTQIELLINGVDPLCEPIPLKASESRGKVVIGEILTHPVITQFDEITIRSDSDRRIVVNMNFGSVL